MPKNRLSMGQNPQTGMNQVLELPAIRIGAPKIDIPEIKIPEIKVTADAADMAPIANAMNQLGQAIAQVANTQTAILEALSSVINKDPIVNVAAPRVTVKAPDRKARDYYVEFERDRGETIGMRISTESPN